MAELFIEFNCMCLFATKQGERAVHVLMPTSSGEHDHDHAHDHAHDLNGNHDPATENGGGDAKVSDRHWVKLLYVNRAGEVKDPALEGWALTLADREPVHDSARAIRNEPRVANLSAIAGMRVNTDLLGGSDPDRLAARVTIDGGEIVRVETQPHIWKLGETRQAMAHQVTWRIPNVDRTLKWSSIGAQDPPPLVSLDDVQPIGQTADGEPVCRMYLYHVMEGDLPPTLPPNKAPRLGRDFVIRHFPMYYGLMGDPGVATSLVPSLAGSGGGGGAPPSGMHFCKTAQVWDDLTGPGPVVM